MNRSDTIVSVPTEAQKRKIIELAKLDYTTGAISQELGIPVHTVKRVRSAAGVVDPPGRPATGTRARVHCRVDEDVEAQIDANSVRDGVFSANVVEAVVTAWARGQELPTRARKP